MFDKLGAAPCPSALGCSPPAAIWFNWGYLCGNAQIEPGKSAIFIEPDKDEVGSLMIHSVYNLAVFS
tara:strand:+ start:381 stop:581 length:201 start_codon:yes stop_codon:yes gene_type:complete